MTTTQPSAFQWPVFQIWKAMDILPKSAFQRKNQVIQKIRKTRNTENPTNFLVCNNHTVNFNHLLVTVAPQTLLVCADLWPRVEPLSNFDRGSTPSFWTKGRLRLLSRHLVSEASRTSCQTEVCAWPGLRPCPGQFPDWCDCAEDACFT